MTFNSKKISKEVYSPSDDSYLLEDCILTEDLTGKKCLDLGTGSGIQGIAMLKRGAKEVTIADINPNALKESKKNILSYLKEKKSNKTKTQNAGQAIHVKKTNLFSNLQGKFDFISFNPPYVPSDEVKWVDLDGGKDGRETIDKFLSQVNSHLTNEGIVLLLVSSLNKPTAIIKKFKEKGFQVKIVGRKKLFFEELLVLRAARSN